MNWLKSAAVTLLDHGVTDAWMRPVARGIATVFMLHRFHDPGRGVEGVDPEALRRCLSYLRRRRYTLLTVDDICHRMTAGGEVPSRTVAFTVDDGYYDFPRVGAPIFAEFDSPVTVFPVTGFLDRSGWLWWDRVEHAFASTPRSNVTIDFGNGSEAYAWSGDKDRQAAVRRVTARLKDLPNPEKLELIERILQDLDVDPSGDLPERYAAMTWDQARYWSERGADFGCHTITHPILSHTTEDTARREVLGSRDRVESELGRCSWVFCYPDGTVGSYTTREVRILRDLGFTAAMTSIPDYVRLKDFEPDHHRFELPRFFYEAREATFKLTAAGFGRFDRLGRKLRLVGGEGDPLSGRPTLGRAGVRRPKGTVLMVAYHFAPENQSGTHRPLHFARQLQEAGHRVLVLTRTVESLDSVDASLSRVFPFPDHITRVGRGRTLGDHYLWWKERVAPAAHDPMSQTDYGREVALRRGLLGSVRRHVAAWDELPDMERAWYRGATRAGIDLAREESVDVVFATGPPWTGLRVGWGVAREIGCPLITDFRDPWSARTGRYFPFPTKWFRWRVESWERRIVNDSSRVLFASPGIMDAAGESFPHALAGHFETVLNGSDVPLSTDGNALGGGQPLKFRHFGSLYGGRSIAPLVEALAVLVHRGLVRPEELTVESVGPEASDEALGLRADSGRVPIRRRPTLPFCDAVELMQEPSVLVVPQPDMFRRQIPTKLYDYLCTGNPVLILSPENSATWAVGRSFSRCRRLEHHSDPGNVEALGELIRQWRDGELTRQAASADAAFLSKDALARRLVAVVEEVLARDQG